MNILSRIRILPILIIVAGLSFTIRVGEFVSGLQGMGEAQAQEQVNNEPPPLPDRPNVERQQETAPEQQEAAEDEMSDTMPMDDMNMASGAEEEDSAPSILDLSEQDPDWRDATEAEYEYSETQRDIYKELAERRRQIENREKALTRQAALLEAAERELDQKLRELTSIQREIEGLLEEQSAEDKARIQSLVKIYEGMKAKDAARIFNTLDVDVLMRVMSRMSERKSAPILAEMDPERARTVTILLAQQKQLPGMSP